MLLKDGVKYLPHDYAKESELEDIVVKHYRDIFGEKSLYFPIKKRITSKTGEKSVPDGYLVDFGRNHFYFIEIELESHPEYDHISKQIGRFISALVNFGTRQKIASVMKDYVEEDGVRKEFVKVSIGPSTNIYQYFLEDVLGKVSNQDYQTLVIIDEESKRIRQACGILNPKPKIIELKTFKREKVGLPVHIHQFEPLFESLPKKKPPRKPTKKRAKIMAVPREAFIFPILSALVEMDGQGRVKDILDSVEKRMKPLFSELDYERTKSKVIRWRNRAMRMRLGLVKDGLLKGGSPRGIWEITQKGIEYYHREMGSSQGLVLKDFQQ